MKKILISAIIFGAVLPISVSADELSDYSNEQYERSETRTYTQGHTYTESGCPKSEDYYYDNGWKNSGVMMYGCNTIGIDEVVTHYKQDTSSDYQAYVEQSHYSGTGPKRDDYNWSNIEITYYNGRMEHGVFRYE